LRLQVAINLNPYQGLKLFLQFNEHPIIQGCNQPKSLSGIETPPTLITGANWAGVSCNQPKSLSGIETASVIGIPLLRRVAINLNPYQGLKQMQLSE